MGFFSEFSKAVNGDESGARYSVAGLEVKCPHCGGTRFFEGSALLDSRGMSFMGFDWASKGAMTLTCAHCGHVDWFADGDAIEELS
ncbi:DNA-binding protein [Collinsella stercoris]|uniref:DNA-binding protein n=1 Tax=Collinsella stercoris TaxID=147206 RepID=UPI00248DA668|nr:DNA-binding protein [Collinsella stercoris]MEE0613286.1 DNA-binding protein [Collinsella stercoris]